MERLVFLCYCNEHDADVDPECKWCAKSTFIWVEGDNADEALPEEIWALFGKDNT